MHFLLHGVQRPRISKGLEVECVDALCVVLISSCVVWSSYTVDWKSAAETQVAAATRCNQTDDVCSRPIGSGRKDRASERDREIGTETGMRLSWPRHVAYIAILTLAEDSLAHAGNMQAVNGRRTCAACMQARTLTFASHWRTIFVL